MIYEFFTFFLQSQYPVNQYDTIINGFRSNGKEEIWKPDIIDLMYFPYLFLYNKMGDDT